MTWKIKLICFGVLLAVLGGGYLVIRHQSNTIVNQKIENSQLTSANVDLKKDAALQASSAKVSDDAVASSVSTTQVAQAKSDKITQQTEVEKAKIVKQYESLAADRTPEQKQKDDEAEVNAISKVQIVSIWKSYCQVNTGDVNCQNPDFK